MSRLSRTLKNTWKSTALSQRQFEAPQPTIPRGRQLKFTPFEAKSDGIWKDSPWKFLALTKILGLRYFEHLWPPMENVGIVCEVMSTQNVPEALQIKSGEK